MSGALISSRIICSSSLLEKIFRDVPRKTIMQLFSYFKTPMDVKNHNKLTKKDTNEMVSVTVTVYCMYANRQR